MHLNLGIKSGRSSSIHPFRALQQVYCDAKLTQDLATNEERFELKGLAWPAHGLLNNAIIVKTNLKFSYNFCDVNLLLHFILLMSYFL
jgi:hypothetical protein